jgi:hypothetical protein
MRSIRMGLAKAGEAYEEYLAAATGAFSGLDMGDDEQRHEVNDTNHAVKRLCDSSEGFKLVGSQSETHRKAPVCPKICDSFDIP